MPENANELFNNIIIILSLVCICFVFFKLFYTRIKDKFAPTKTADAQVVDKFVSDGFSKIYGSMAKTPQYFVVFDMGNKKRSFQVSAFSYNGYKVNQRGMLKYKGTRLIEFQ